MEYVLVMVSVILLYRAWRYRLYRRSIIIIYWLTINTFVMPVIYYSFMEGDAYKVFSHSDYIIFCMLGIVFLFIVIIFTELVNSSECNHICIKHSIVNLKSNKIGCVYTIFVFSICILYFLIYRSSFPLHQIMFGFYDGSLSRPDITGVMPHYITMQCFFTLIVPMIYLYMKEIHNLHGYKNILLLLVVIFFSLIGGNKGIFVYLVVFLWLFELKMRIGREICLLLLVAFVAYNLLMNDGGGSLYEMCHSLIRRFFVTQGATLLDTLALYNSGYQLSEYGYEKEVFNYIYGVYGGSAPCYYLGDFIVRFGYIFGMMAAVTVFGLLIFIEHNIDGDGNLYMYQKWPLYVVMFLLGNSGFGTSFYLRVAILSISVYILNANNKRIKTKKAG